MRSVFSVRIFLADKTCFFEVLDGSPGGFLEMLKEILDDPFYAGPRLSNDITAAIKIDERYNGQVIAVGGLSLGGQIAVEILTQHLHHQTLTCRNNCQDQNRGRFTGAENHPGFCIGLRHGDLSIKGPEQYAKTFTEWIEE